MADDAELELGEAGGEDAGGGKKKKKGLGGFLGGTLLPTILKFVAIGLGALILIVTVSVITFNILNQGGRSQTIVSESSPYMGARPRHAMFTAIGVVRTRTSDPTPHAVMVDMVIAYDLNDSAAQTELIARMVELQDFVRSFFRSKSVDDLTPENEPQLKREIIELLNTQILTTARVRNIFFRQLDVMEA